MTEREPLASQFIRALLKPLRNYHDYKVEGLEYIPRSGPGVVVTNHSLATYDSLMLAAVVQEETGRIPTGLGDDLIFEIPLLRELAGAVGLLPASPANGAALLRAGNLLFLAPGGMREALRPSEERYQIRWSHRRGFARLALQMGAPVILAACPAADDLFTVLGSPITDIVYDTLKVPFPIFVGRGGLPVPQRIPLVHYLSPPLMPPPYEPQREEEQVVQFHADVVDAMAKLMQEHAVNAERSE